MLVVRDIMQSKVTVTPDASVRNLDRLLTGEQTDGVPVLSRMETTTVEDTMTPVTSTAEPDTPVAELCDFLVRGRIHRAGAVENRRPEGIATSADVLRAVSDGRSGR